MSNQTHTHTHQKKKKQHQETLQLRLLLNTDGPLKAGDCCINLSVFLKMMYKNKNNKIIQ